MLFIGLDVFNYYYASVCRVLNCLLDSCYFYYWLVLLGSVGNILIVGLTDVVLIVTGIDGYVVGDGDGDYMVLFL